MGVTNYFKTIQDLTNQGNLTLKSKKKPGVAGLMTIY